MKKSTKNLLLFLGILICTNGCSKKNAKHLADNYYSLGLAELDGQHQSHHNYKSALVFIEKALKYHTSLEYMATKAQLLHFIGDMQQAKQTFEKALTLPAASNMRCEVLNNYACVLANSGSTQQACVIWQKLTRDTAYLTPEVALVNLSKVYVECHEYDKAQIALHQAITLAPSYVDAHYYLASVLYWQGDAKKAKDHLFKVLALAPDHVGADQLKKLIA